MEDVNSIHQDNLEMAGIERVEQKGQNQDEHLETVVDVATAILPTSAVGVTAASHDVDLLKQKIERVQNELELQNKELHRQIKELQTQLEMQSKRIHDLEERELKTITAETLSEHIDLETKRYTMLQSISREVLKMYHQKTGNAEPLRKLDLLPPVAEPQAYQDFCWKLHSRASSTSKWSTRQKISLSRCYARSWTKVDLSLEPVFRSRTELSRKP